jgi:hypothetical protein
MSNDSREAFEEAFRLRNVSYPLTRSTTGLRDYKEERTEGAWQGWQAAQSRHAAEREALVRKCAEQRLDKAIFAVKLEDFGFSREKVALAITAVGEVENIRNQRILALLDSVSQG